MKEIKNKIEAVLFTTGRFMNVEEIGKLAGIGSLGIVRDALKELILDYQKKDTALEIFAEKGRYKLNIRKKYVYITADLLTHSELDRPTQETLALIAYKQPMMQSDVIKIRGSTAYDHIKILREEEFVTSERYGRTRLLKITPKFYDYFDVVEDQLQAKFSEIEQKIGSPEEVQKTLQEENKILKEVEDVQDVSLEFQNNSENLKKESLEESQEKKEGVQMEKEKEESLKEEKEEKKKKKSLAELEEELHELVGDGSEQEAQPTTDGGSGSVPEGSILFD